MCVFSRPIKDVRVGIEKNLDQWVTVRDAR